MKPVHVAVGVIHRDGQILLSLRHPDAHQGNLWEFPGGKVESGESVPEALARELEEELGILIGPCEAMLEVSHDYGDKTVLLDVWWIEGFAGQEQGREGQALAWSSAADLASYEFPAANLPIVEAVISRLNAED